MGGCIFHTRTILVPYSHHPCLHTGSRVCLKKASEQEQVLAKHRARYSIDFSYVCVCGTCHEHAYGDQKAESSVQDAESEDLENQVLSQGGNLISIEHFR